MSEPVPADGALLQRNLNALARRQPDVAQAIAAAPPRADVVFVPATRDEAVTAELDGRGLASRRKPLDEGDRFARAVNLEDHGGIVLMGMGVGHHASALATRCAKVSALVVFEPDLGLLRAVLERVDHSAWLGEDHVRLVVDADDEPALQRTLRGLEAMLSVGVELVDHAPSAGRLGTAAGRFGQAVARAVAAMRMHVITTMVQSDVTVRNELMNLGEYVRWPGITELENAAAGRSAIVVAAGPSLERTIGALKTPGLRERCVIICVQTVLKKLLAEGVRPHYVTAIDYHEISTRFYEGLTAENVEGVTLVAEARANAAILDAYPGAKRLPRDEYLDKLLHGVFGAEDAPDRGRLTAAATVAHLSYYLARHLGCEPVILTGQDLAFTDGQYYGPGAAIHRVWASELNAFNTLEMMEWQRIVRNRTHLHRVSDHLGRPVYTDDQMATYLAQFERDFAPDHGRGLRIIDATEGGVHKRFTDVMTLAEAVERFAGEGSPKLPELPQASADDRPATRARTADRVRKVRRQVETIARRTRETLGLLDEMRDKLGDRAGHGDVVKRVHALRDEVHALDPGFHLLMKLNQLGGYKRFKADRAIELAQHGDWWDEQAARIDRDQTNLEWLEDVAEVLRELMSVAERALSGGEKRTRDITPRDPDAPMGVEVKPVRTVAVLRADRAWHAWDVEVGGKPALVRTAERLTRCARLTEIVVATPERERVNAMLHEAGGDVRQWMAEGRLVVEDAPEADEHALRPMRAARAWAEDCWRGGLAGMTCYDEALDAVLATRVLERHGGEALLIVGADWVAVDHALCDEVIERHAESPSANPLTFTQAPPGCCGAVIGRAFLAELARGRSSGANAWVATVGGVLGYQPQAPRHDPIARACCVSIDAQLRDAAVRCVADTPMALAALSALDERTLDGDTPAIARGVRAVLEEGTVEPRELVIEDAGAGDVVDVLRGFAASSPGGLVTVAGAWGDVVEATRVAREAGLFVHTRTSGAGGSEEGRALVESGADVVGLDMVAQYEVTHRLLTGGDGFAASRACAEAVLSARTPVHGLPSVWLAPRIERRDAVYEEVEAFFDAWVARCGVAIIDPPCRVGAGERIRALPVPDVAAGRDAWRRRVHASGRVVRRAG
jgi:hypothetical protein